MPTRTKEDASLFHYTNHEGSKGILREKLIRVTPEDGRFAWFGEGVYMTALAPSVGRKQLLYNNHRKYDTKDRNLLAKTFFYFKIDSQYLPEVRKVNDKYSRDIYVYPYNINLRIIPYEHGLSDNYNDENDNDNQYRLTSNGVQPPIFRPLSPSLATNTRRAQTTGTTELGNTLGLPNSIIPYNSVSNTNRIDSPTLISRPTSKYSRPIQSQPTSNILVPITGDETSVTPIVVPRSNSANTAQPYNIFNTPVSSITTPEVAITPINSSRPASTVYNGSVRSINSIPSIMSDYRGNYNHQPKQKYKNKECCCTIL